MLKELGQHARHGELHSFNVINDGGEQRTGRVFLEECRRAPQDRIVEIIPEVRDHAKAGIIHKIGAGVITDPFQHGRRDQGEGYNGPRILEVGRNKLLEVNYLTASRNSE